VNWREPPLMRTESALIGEYTSATRAGTKGPGGARKLDLVGDGLRDGTTGLWRRRLRIRTVPTGSSPHADGRDTNALTGWVCQHRSSWSDATEYTASERSPG